MNTVGILTTLSLPRSLAVRPVTNKQPATRAWRGRGETIPDENSEPLDRNRLDGSEITGKDGRGKKKKKSEVKAQLNTVSSRGRPFRGVSTFNAELFPRLSLEFRSEMKQWEASMKPFESVSLSLPPSLPFLPSLNSHTPTFFF